MLITVIRPIALKAFEIRKIDDFGGQTGDVEGERRVSNGMPNVIQNTIATSPVDGEAPEAILAKVDPIVKVNEFADSSPQDLVNILRKWLNEES